MVIVVPLNSKEVTDQPLTWTEHLDELRTRLIICVVSVAVSSAAAFAFSRQLLFSLKQWIATQVKIELLAFSPVDAFLSLIKIALFTGILLSSPIIIYQIWRFILPALSRRERGILAGVVPVSLLLFLLGAAFGLGVLVPVSLRVLLQAAGDSVQALLAVDKFVGFVGVCLLLLGVMFQVPLVLVVLKKAGRLQVKTITGSRKYVIVGIFIMAATLTPPDPITQVLLALPMLFLFELSVILIKIM